ncbi:hypothetical protein Tco_1541500 [Tanacetum coccineum]
MTILVHFTYCPSTSEKLPLVPWPTPTSYSSESVKEVVEYDTFLVPEDSMPPGIESNFDPGGGEIVVSQNVEDDDSFTFVIRTFLPYLIYPVESPLLLSTRSEDTIFDTPGHLHF